MTNQTDLATIEFHVTDHVATVALNRPEKLNSFTKQMAADLAAAWARVRADEDIHVPHRAEGELPRSFTQAARLVAVDAEARRAAVAWLRLARQ